MKAYWLVAMVVGCAHPTRPARRPLALPCTGAVLRGVVQGARTVTLLAADLPEGTVVRARVVADPTGVDGLVLRAPGASFYDFADEVIGDPSPTQDFGLDRRLVRAGSVRLELRHQGPAGRYAACVEVRPP